MVRGANEILQLEGAASNHRVSHFFFFVAREMRTRVTKRYVRTGLKKGIIVTVFRKRQRPIIYWINRAGFFNCRENGDCEDGTIASDGIVEGGAAVEQERADSGTERSAPEECGKGEGDGIKDGESKESVRRSDEEGDGDGAKKGSKVANEYECVIDIGRGTLEEQCEQLRNTLERLAGIKTIAEACEYATSCGSELKKVE